MADFILDCLFTCIKAGIGSMIFASFFFAVKVALHQIKSIL